MTAVKIPFPLSEKVDFFFRCLRPAENGHYLYYKQQKTTQKTKQNHNDDDKDIDNDDNEDEDDEDNIIRSKTKRGKTQWEDKHTNDNINKCIIGDRLIIKEKRMKKKTTTITITTGNG